MIRAQYGLTTSSKPTQTSKARFYYTLTFVSIDKNTPILLTQFPFFCWPPLTTFFPLSLSLSLSLSVYVFLPYPFLLFVRCPPALPFYLLCLFRFPSHSQPSPSSCTCRCLLHRRSSSAVAARLVPVAAHSKLIAAPPASVSLLQLCSSSWPFLSALMPLLVSTTNRCP